MEKPERSNQVSYRAEAAHSAGRPAQACSQGSHGTSDIQPWYFGRPFRGGKRKMSGRTDGTTPQSYRYSHSWLSHPHLGSAESKPWRRISILLKMRGLPHRGDRRKAANDSRSARAKETLSLRSGCSEGAYGGSWFVSFPRFVAVGLAAKRARRDLGIVFGHLVQKHRKRLTTILARTVNPFIAQLLIARRYAQV